MRGKFAIVSLLIVIGLMLWLFWPGPAYDPERVHPRLRALQQPYQSVKAVYYMDGGSIGIEIVDRGGSREQFALPHRANGVPPVCRIRHFLRKRHAQTRHLGRIFSKEKGV